MKLEGNTILITGGTSGIGFAFAKAFLQRKNTVIVTGRDAAKLERAKQQLPGLAVVQSDVSRPADVEALRDRMAREFPALNVLVNNAGVLRRINLNDAGGTPDELTAEIDSNLKGPIWMVRAFLPLLAKAEAAAIVNVSSGLAFVPLPVAPVYSATKAALHSYTLSLRAQLRRTKVQVFEVLPPTTRTEGLAAMNNGEDLKGVAVMGVDEMVAASLAGLAADRLEITPGQSGQLRLMSRVAPAFILRQLSRSVERMLGS